MGAVVLMISLAAQSPIANLASTGTFCERLAAQLGMVRRSDVPRPYWQLQSLNAFQRFVIGGQTTFAIKILDSATGEAVTHKGCELIPKGTSCKLVGPMKFEIVAGSKVGKVDVEADEQAEVRVISTRLRCEDRPSP